MQLLSRLLHLLELERGSRPEVVKNVPEATMDTFLRVGQQVFFQGLIFGGRRAAHTGAGNGADGHGAIPQTHQYFRAGSGDLKLTEVQEKQKR